MQLLPLLLPVLFFLLAEAARLDDWKNRTNSVRDSVKDKSRSRFEKMSQGSKQRLTSQIGNLDARKARLAKFQNKPPRQLTPEQKAKLQERLAKLTPIQTERPNEDVATDLFEVNMKQGVSEYMYQGDIDLTDEQADGLADKVSSDPANARNKRQATTVYGKWASNTVYFYYDSSVNDRKKAVVAAAHQFIQARTCVNFVQSSTAVNRIKVFNGSGCFSYVGMLGGEQTLSMGDGCEAMGTAAHEFSHALGIWHMQMRSDRDTYVTIDMTYVPADQQYNFDKLSTSETVNYTPYEYGSVMHYGGNSFTNPSDKLSIIPKDINYAYTMGNFEPSFYDILMINKHYGCDAACPAATSAQCKNGGVPNPRNCATCTCPFGYEGTLCDQRPTGCGETLTATSSWQSKSFSYGDTTDNINVRDAFSYCNYLINAPAGQNVEIQMTSMWNTQCQNGCPFNGIEIKGNPDIRITNPRYCCPEFANKTITSYTNPTPLIAFNRYYFTTFTIQYRAVPTVPITTTPPPPVTTRPPTVPPPSRNCRSMGTAENCANNKLYGFCTSPDYSFQVIKYNCATECGLCGQAANPCVDLQDNCPQLAASGACTVNDPMVLEYLCAKSCGYCANPN